jgi:glycosyltransferase involved in cell wall biosynthesis
MLRFSIITVSYNSMATIGRTLDSVASQDWPAVEHLVIDGGSHDETLQIVKQRGTRVARLVSEPDDGIYDAMNKGVSLATGDVIAMLNADDYYADPEVLSRVARVFESNDVEAVFGDVTYFSADEPNHTVRRFNSGRFRPDRLSWGWMPAHPALFLRRTEFDRVGPFRTDLRIAGDFEFIIRVFADGRIARPVRWVYLPEVLTRMQTGGVSTRGLRSTLQLNREMIWALRSNGLPASWWRLLSRYPAKLLEFARVPR